jgi:hypothetical protein
MSSARRVVYFLGLETPYEARLCLRTMPTLESLDPILQAVLAHLLGTAEGDTARRLQQSMSLDSATLGALFTGVHWIMRVCMRSSMKAKALAIELADIKVHPPFVEPILMAVEEGCAPNPQQPCRPADLRYADSRNALTFGRRAQLALASAAVDTSQLPTLDSMRWRLDVAISTSALHRVLRPHLTMQCALSDGTGQTFHVSKQVRAFRLAIRLGGYHPTGAIALHASCALMHAAWPLFAALQ